MVAPIRAGMYGVLLPPVPAGYQNCTVSSRWPERKALSARERSTRRSVRVPTRSGPVNGGSWICALVRAALALSAEHSPATTMINRKSSLGFGERERDTVGLLIG